MPRALILIVDDDEGSSAAIAAYVEGAGLDAACVDGGAAAFALIDRIQPSLILLDAVMPGVDGFETCRAIKSNERWRAIPVIFMTGLSDTAHIVAGLQAGGVDYVVKPVVLPELLARINVHLATARHAQTVQWAIDASGRGLFALGKGGDVAWATPEARRLLASPGVVGDGGSASWSAVMQLRPGMIHWVQDEAGDQRIAVERIDGQTDAEPLFRIGAHGDGPELQSLRDAFALTPREAGVLRWIARGKSSRDVSVILNISPRTVDKHLEQIFRKMGVENRSAATARATATLHAT